MEKEFYDVKEVCEMFGVSRSTLYSLIRNKHLDKINVSERRVKITGESLDRYIKKQQNLLNRLP